MELKLLVTYLVGAAATGLAGAVALRASLRRGIQIPPSLVVVALTLPAFLLAGQVCKLYAHKDYADFTVWLQLVNNLAEDQGPVSSLQDGLIPGTGHWFSSHFTPLVYLFAVPYALVPRPETLLVSQFLCLQVALWALYLYAKHSLASHKEALLVTAVFALYPTYQYINLYEFEMLRFSIPLLLFTVWSLESGRYTAYWVFLGLTLLVREEVALTTTLLGLYIWIVRKHERGIGAATVTISLAYFLVVTQLVMPAFRASGNAEHIAAAWFAPLGKTIPEVAWGLVTKPDVVLGLVLDPLKLANVFMYVIPVLFVSLAAWPTVLIGSANVGLNLLSGSVTHTSYFLYYLSPAIAVLFVALVKGIKTVGDCLDDWRKRCGWRGDGRSAVLTGVFSAAFVANVFFGPSPLSLQFWVRDYQLAPFRTLNFHYTQYWVTDHDRRLREVLAVVPKEATVSAEQHLLPDLFDRKALKVFPDIAGVDYVVIDKFRKEKTGVATVPGSWDGLRQNPQLYYNWVEQDRDHWELAIADDGYAVYRRHTPS